MQEEVGNGGQDLEPSAWTQQRKLGSQWDHLRRPGWRTKAWILLDGSPERVGGETGEGEGEPDFVAPAQVDRSPGKAGATVSAAVGMSKGQSLQIPGNF